MTEQPHVHVQMGTDATIPPAGTEECPGVLNIKGEHFPCELQPPHTGWAHSNKKAEAIWE